MATLYDEILNFIQADVENFLLISKGEFIDKSMLDFILNHKGIQNRLALFLSKIDLDKINDVDCLEFFKHDGKKDKKDIIVQFFINTINAELILLADPLRANKKYLRDAKRLNKLQKEIIEKYYFNDTFLNFFRRIGIKDELISSVQNYDYLTIFLLLSRMV